MKSIEVRASRNYTINIKNGLLSATGRLCAEVLRGKNVLLLTDETVATLYLEKVKRSLKAAGFTVVPYVVPTGEQSKSTATYLEIVSFLAQHGFTRSDAVGALGGGVVGDLGGFCAATYLRGIGFVQIPTTLLACVDSSVGGKTAVNLPEGKNLLGAFYQPQLVICDPTVLGTLPPERYADGMAEVIKYAMIRDRKLVNDLEMRRLSDAEIIARCVEIKRDIVEEDEHDRGVRQVLNYGHTIGHAVEKCSLFSISHGNAVAIGMAIVSRAMMRMGTMTRDACYRLEGLLIDYQLPVMCEFSAEALFEAALSDKKRENETLNLVTVPSLGESELLQIPIEELLQYIKLGMVR